MRPCIHTGRARMRTKTRREMPSRGGDVPSIASRPRYTIQTRMKKRTARCRHGQQSCPPNPGRPEDSRRRWRTLSQKKAAHHQASKNQLNLRVRDGRRVEINICLEEMLYTSTRTRPHTNQNPHRYEKQQGPRGGGVWRDLQVALKIGFRASMVT